MKHPVLGGRCCGRVRNEMKVQGKQTGFIVRGGVAEGGCQAGGEWTGHRPRNSPAWRTRGSAKWLSGSGRRTAEPLGHMEEPHPEVIRGNPGAVWTHSLISSAGRGSSVGRQGQPRAEEMRCLTGGRDSGCLSDV